MTHRVSISILFCTISVLAAQAQWSKQDSIRLQKLLDGDGELNINTEAVKSIQFDFNSKEKEIKGKPAMSLDKPWMKFRNDLPKNFDDTTRWIRPKYIRMLPYTAFTKWNEDPMKDIPYLNGKKDTMKMTWKLQIRMTPGIKNGYVIVPYGMDQSVTPSNNPLISGFDTNKFLYESLTKRGRSIRRNRKHANAWKTYKNYVPNAPGSQAPDKNALTIAKRDSLLHDTLSVPKDSLATKQDSLLFKNKINGKHQTNKSH